MKNNVNLAEAVHVLWSLMSWCCHYSLSPICLGMATGVVTNTGVTHATPASAYANAASRVWESDSDMPSEGPDGGRENCSDIAMQLIEKGHDIEVDLNTRTCSHISDQQCHCKGAFGEVQYSCEWQ